MKKLFAFIFCLLVLKATPCQGQTNSAQGLILNAGSNAIISGFGALLNKKPNEKGGKVFIRGFWQGAVGGGFVHLSKQMVYEFGETDNSAWIWGSKLVNAAGVSIAENASANEKFLLRWHVNFGFTRFEFQNKSSEKFSVKLMPFALGALIITSTKASLNLEQTFRTGQFFFSTTSSGFPDSGYSIANTIVLNPSYFDSKSIAHEVIHTYQYQGLSTLNPYMTRIFEPLIFKESTAFGKIAKKWIYIDTNLLALSGFYYLGGLGNKCYFDNPFEQEANFYSMRLDCSALSQ